MTEQATVDVCDVEEDTDTTTRYWECPHPECVRFDDQGRRLRSDFDIYYYDEKRRHLIEVHGITPRRHALRERRSAYGEIVMNNRKHVDVGKTFSHQKKGDSQVNEGGSYPK